MAESSQIVLAQGDSLPGTAFTDTVILTVNPVTGFLHVIDDLGNSEDLVTSAHDHNTLYYLKAEVDLALAGKKDDFTENTGFNKNFGNSYNNVSRGNHGHEWKIIDMDGITVTVAYDPIRNKVLSLESRNLDFGYYYVQNNIWMHITFTYDNDNGYIMPHDGVVVGVTGMCENGMGVGQNFRLYINSTEVDPGFVQFPLTPGMVQYTSTDKDIDFHRGDRIRLRAGTAGMINDTNISVIVKWGNV